LMYISRLIISSRGSWFDIKISKEVANGLSSEFFSQMFSDVFSVYYSNKS
jgi:hypothetical protein